MTSTPTDGTDTSHDLAGDLAYVRSIAEAGQSRPVSGGPFFVIWGVVTTVSLLYQYALYSGLISASPWTVAVVWFSSAFIGIFGSIALGKRMFAERVALTNTDRVEDAVWSRAGAFFFVFSMGLFGLPFLQKFLGLGDGNLTFVQFNMFPPVTFGIYAIAMAATAATSGNVLLSRSSWASLGFMEVTLFTIGTAFQTLLAALGTFCILVVPGVMLTRRQREFRLSEAAD